MGEHMDAKIAEGLRFTLRLEIQKRLSPAKRKANQIDPDSLASYLVQQIQMSKFIVRMGEPMQSRSAGSSSEPKPTPLHVAMAPLPVRNRRPKRPTDSGSDV